MKIWDCAKLDSVLNRCQVPAQSNHHYGQSKNLASLLESERRYGTTTERDPTTLRHDFRYFSKNSYFVLVEDINQQLATIAAKEYMITHTKDGKEKGDWPVAHCHPLARGPFLEYNDKEERKRAKVDRLEKESAEQRAATVKRVQERAAQHASLRKTDLRRTVSMTNLQKATQEEDRNPQDARFDEPLESTIARGEMSGLQSAAASGYLAASGNSVGITSAYGTTSCVGSSTLRIAGSGTQRLSIDTRSRVNKEVITSRRAAIGNESQGRGEETESKGSGSKEKASASSMMPPPDMFPTRVGRLRKAKSTTTMRLPKRDEKSKPGYCESCRQKFDDFKSVCCSTFRFSARKLT